MNALTGESETTRKTLLVSGGAGFIGSCFTELATAGGARVIVLDALTYAGNRANLTSSVGPVELVVGNILDTQLVSNLLTKFRVDAVINFAAESHVDRSISAPSLFVETNVTGTCSLLNASLAHWQTLEDHKKPSFRYIQISTDEVYGELKANEEKFSENTPLRPNSPYSASKAAADLLVRAWHQTYKFPAIITRCSNNYGPRQFPEKLIPKMIECAVSNKKLPVYASGSNIRDWIHVEDHCAGIMAALLKGIPGNIYCFGGNSERSNLDVVKTICSLLDRLNPRDDEQAHASAIEHVEDRMGHDFRYAIDDSFARRELGWSTKYKFEFGLRETIKWYLEKMNLKITEKAAA